MASPVLCACGCGETLIKRAPGSQGEAFKRGHHGRNRTVKGYRAIYRKEGQTPWVHRLRAQAALGRPLPAKVVVHHVDCDPGNPDARLVICENQAYHKLLHVRMRVQALGGNLTTDKVCSRCEQVKPCEDFSPNPKGHNYMGRSAYCRSCATAVQRQYYAQRLTPI